MNRYYKVVDSDGNLIQIGNDDNTGIEITEEEYDELYQYIQENAAHIIDTEEELTMPTD